MLYTRHPWLSAVCIALEGSTESTLYSLPYCCNFRRWYQQCD